MSAEARSTAPPAVFREGYPENLPAAALDALEWLRLYRRLHPPSGEEKGRLDRTIAALEAELRPCLPEVDFACECGRCVTLTGCAKTEAVAR